MTEFKAAKISIFQGTGSATWILYILLYGAVLFFFLRNDNPGLIGILAAAFAAIKLESNDLKRRIRNLEFRLNSANPQH